MRNDDNQNSNKISRSEFMRGAAGLGAAMALPSALHAQSATAGADCFAGSATGESVTAGLDLRGKRYFITGANSGLGFETARVLVLRGGHVYVAARTATKAREAAHRIMNSGTASNSAPALLSGPRGRAQPVVCELTDFDSVLACARLVRDDAAGDGGGLDALVCNAGIMALPELERARGLEKQFVVNYLGHFLLAQALAGSLARAPGGRVVTLSSGLITQAPAGGIAFDNLDGSRGYDAFAAYGQSKLAMAIMAVEFARRFALAKKGQLRTANTLRPGVIETGLFRNMAWYMRLGVFLTGWAWLKSVEQGAATQCFVATHPSLADVSGKFFEDCRVIEPDSPYVFDRSLGAKLYDVSLELLGDYRRRLPEAV